jgi:hypothetical protein
MDEPLWKKRLVKCGFYLTVSEGVGRNKDMRQASSTCIDFSNHSDVYSMSVIFCRLLRTCIAAGSAESHDPNQALFNNSTPNTCSSSSNVSTNLEEPRKTIFKLQPSCVKPISVFTDPRRCRPMSESISLL